MSSIMTHARSIALFAVCAWALELQAQYSTTPSVLASCGGAGTANGYKMEWTVGELAIHSLGNDQYHFTQGFHQPDSLHFTTSIRESEPTSILQAWPNPAKDELFVRSSTPILGNTVLDIVGIDGKLSWSQAAPLSGEVAVIPLRSIEPGSYCLVIRSSQFPSPQSLRFVKIQ